MLFNSDNVLWAVAFLGLMLHVLHAPRMPTFYAKKLQNKKNRFSIPNWVFWPVWLTVLVCDAVFGVLFFMENSIFDNYYQWMVWVYLVNLVAMLEWNWVYFNVICFYAVAVLGVVIALAHGGLLALTLLYGNQHWFTILIIAVPIAWTFAAAVFSCILAYNEAAKLKNYKKEAGEMTEYIYDIAESNTSKNKSAAKAPLPPPPNTSTPPEPTSEAQVRYGFNW